MGLSSLPQPIVQPKRQRGYSLKNVVKYWGLPRHIMTDRDPRFTGRLWDELFRLLGTELHFSTSFHHQTDGQTERANALLECYLRHFVSANQRGWGKLLDVAQFSYNLQKSEATKRSPFELATGQQPLTPHGVDTDSSTRSPGALKMAKSWKEQADIAHSYLDKAAKKMKKWAKKTWSNPAVKQTTVAVGGAFMGESLGGNAAVNKRAKVSGLVCTLSRSRSGNSGKSMIFAIDKPADKGGPCSICR